MPVRGASQTEQLRRHASLEEYRAFLSRRTTTGTVAEFSKRYLRFVRLYPDLEMWFAAPLPERVGRLYGETREQTSYRISNQARLFMHRLVMNLAQISESDIDALDEAVCRFGDRPDVARFFGSSQQYREAVHVYRTHLQITRVVLYHSGIIATPPRRNPSAPFPTNCATRLRKQKAEPYRMRASKISATQS
jgi:hypothetical protein